MSPDSELLSKLDAALREKRPLTSVIAYVTQQLASTLDIAMTLNNALDRVSTYMEAEAGSIFLLEGEEAGSMSLVCHECIGPVNIKGLRIAAGEGIVGKTVGLESTQIVRDVLMDPSFSSAIDDDTGFVTRSILCAPLVVQGRCIGAIELINKRSGDGLFDGEDVDLVTAIAASAALAIHSARMAQELVEQERVKRELELAREIQSGLLPSAGPKSVPVYGFNQPAREVSGDYFDYLALPDGRIYFSLADVAGKGMNASLLMAKTSSLMRCLARSASSVSELLHIVNVELCDTGRMGYFVTAICGFYDTVAGRLTLGNAGHMPAMLVEDDGGISEYPALSMPLGIDVDADFPEVSLTPAPSALFLYTDGVTEARNADGEQFGVERLRAVVREAKAGTTRSKLGAIVDRMRSEGFSATDDLTLLQVDLRAGCAGG